MDQLKDFLKQCVKYRFWIAFGVSLLLPIIGYFVGSGAIIAETNNREKAIKDAKTEIGKYTASGIVNDQYKPEAEKKKDVLTQDVNATWRKLYSSQAPLLRWPPEVEERFRSWGRKYPSDIDRNQVQSTIIDYTIAYPEFVSRIYKTFKPINFDEGGGSLTGIVVAPDEKVLLAPAPFSQDSPPELGKVWAEQERLWVVTALLDVVAKVNDGATAKDWDGAIIKQLNLVEVGSPNDQDQVSLAKGETLVPAESLSPEGAAAPAAPAAPASGGPGTGEMMASQMMGAGAAAKTDEVFYLKTEGQQFKILPIKMNVLVDQARLQDFLVGLENSPMAIQVMEIELAKPIAPVVKPTYGDRSAFNFGGMGGMMGGEGYMMAGPGNRGGRPMSGYTGPGMAGNSNMRSGDPGMGPGMAGYPGSRGGMTGYGGAGPVVKKGTDIRSINKAEERKKKDKEASKAKADTKTKVDQYFNVIEVTVYGQARFYLSPPPSPQAEPSTSAPAPAPDAASAPAPAAEAVKEEAPKPEAAAPKGDAPVAEPSAPKADPTGPDASKAGSAGPKP